MPRASVLRASARRVATLVAGQLLGPDWVTRGAEPSYDDQCQFAGVIVPIGF